MAVKRWQNACTNLIILRSKNFEVATALYHCVDIWIANAVEIRSVDALKKPKTTPLANKSKAKQTTKIALPPAMKTR